MKRFLLSFFALSALSFLPEASAQEYTHPTLQPLLQKGEFAAICDSVTRGGLPEKAREYYGMWCAIHRAHYREAEGRLQRFSRREHATAWMLIPKVHIALGLGKWVEAEKALEQLQKARTKDENLLRAVSRTKQWYEDYRRMAANTVPVEVLDRYTGEQVQAIVQALSAGAGKVLEKAFETREGNMRILVLKSEGEEGESLAVSYRLGDGQWEPPQEIKVSGLPAGSYWYPMLLSDGVTLRFGYMPKEGAQAGSDLYVTRWDKEANQLLVPQRLPFPYNSEADDLLYGTTSEGNVSYLLSRRWSEEEGLKLFLLREKNPQNAATADVHDPHTILLDSLTLSHPGALQAYLLKNPSQEERVEDAPVYFTWDHRTVRSQKDLHEPAARKAFEKYRQLLGQYLQDTSALESLRRQYAAEGKPSLESPLSKQIRSLEQEVARKREALAALRNEIIRQEGGK